MGTIGHGYGSEWHLLRYLGYHRAELSRSVATLTSATTIEWLDVPFAPSASPLAQEQEWEGLSFLDATHAAHERWKAFWPQRGSAQRWDAVARLDGPSGPEWLLVEAKAHVGELHAPCQAKSEASITQIDRAFDATRRSCGATDVSSAVWRGSFYQYANRLAVLHFLLCECSPPIPTRLLFIYFAGDHHPRIAGPADAAAWTPEIATMRRSLGIDEHAPLLQRVHHLILPVNPLRTARSSPSVSGSR